VNVFVGTSEEGDTVIGRGVDRVGGDVAFDTELEDSEEVPEIAKGVLVKTLFLPSSLDQ
jgi:hypothetical protein